MWAMVVKEFRELRRDRRTMAMMIVLPVLLLVVFGYAANFKVHDIPVVVVGPGAGQAAALLREPTFHVTEVDPAAGESAAEARLRDGKAVVAVVTGGASPLVLLDGSQLFSAQAAEAALARLAPAAGPAAPRVRILYNPGLTTSWVMVPGLAGLILVFIGTLITSLGVVRERQAGTLEQLAVMPFRALGRDRGQDRAVPAAGRGRPGDHRRHRHGRLPRAVRRQRRGLRPRRRAVPAGDPGHGRPGLHGLAEPGPGHPAGVHDRAARRCCCRG